MYDAHMVLRVKPRCPAATTPQHGRYRTTPHPQKVSESVFPHRGITTTNTNNTCHANFTIEPLTGAEGGMLTPLEM